MGGKPTDPRNRLQRISAAKCPVGVQFIIILLLNGH